MLRERQVAAPLMAQRAAHRALRLAHCRFQPGEGVGIELARLRRTVDSEHNLVIDIGYGGEEGMIR